MRFFVNKIKDENVIIGDEFRHIVKVMRLHAGDKITLFDGDGQNYTAEIIQIKKESLIAKRIASKKNMCEPQKNITLFLSLLKGEKMELVAQKITEIGATELVLFESENSDRKQGNLNFERLHKICVSASKQCGRSTILKIEEQSFDGVIKKLKDFDLIICLHEKIEHISIKDILKPIDENKYGNIAIIVGPEGGLSQKEVSCFESVDAKCVSVGKLILRAETASIYATSVVACKFLL